MEKKVAKKSPAKILTLAGQEVRISNPDKLYFPAAGITKLKLVEYYLAVGEGVLRGIRNRPIVLKRYVHGIEGEFFFQKRAPAKRPGLLLHDSRGRRGRLRVRTWVGPSLGFF